MLDEPAEDLYGLWRYVTDDILDGNYDTLQGANTFHYDNVLAAKTTAFDLDLRKVGLLNPSGRWTRFLNQYTESDTMIGFLEKCEELVSTNSPRPTWLSCRPTQGHNWGNCLMAASFRGKYKEHPATLALYSRTSRFPSTAALDLTFANVLARHVADITQRPVESIQFRWYLDAVFLSAIWAVPYLVEAGRWNEYRGMAKKSEYIRGHKGPRSKKMQFYDALPSHTKLIVRFIQRFDVPSEELTIETIKFGQALRAGQSLHRLLGLQPQRDTSICMPEDFDFTKIGVEIGDYDEEDSE